MRLEEKRLLDFTLKIFKACNLNEIDSLISAEVLIYADKKGISTHGLSRLKRYVAGFKENKIDPKANFKIIKESKSTALIDSCKSMGMPVAYKAMQIAIQKAKQCDISFVTVKDNNHFGIGSYYSDMALKEGLIGFVLTNTGAIGLPTNGLKPMYGTNALSVSVPCYKKNDFCIDFSSTIISRGKVEKSLKEGKKLPYGVALNENGEIEQNPKRIMQCLENGERGGLLPLGGISVEQGSHKGYSLAILVDILTGVISGYKFGRQLLDTKLSATRMSHSFIALNIETFRDIIEFKKDMDDMLQQLIDSPNLDGLKITYPGYNSNKKRKKVKSKA